MNDDISRSRRRVLPRRAVMLTAAASIALLTGACGGSSLAGGSAGSPAPGGPASSSAGASASSSAGPGGSSSAGNSITAQKQLAFSECMRSHGVPGVPTSLPSPSSGAPRGNGHHKLAKASGPDPGSPQWNAALQACRSLLPPSIKDGPGPGGPAHG